MTRNAKSDGSNGEATIRKQIMVLDDHPLVCKGLEELLATTPDLRVVAAFGTAAEALEKFQEHVPDLLLLDLSLPGISGFDFLKDLRIQYPELTVIVLSMYEEAIYAERVLRQGAKGYIMKQESGETVIEAIRCVLSGGVYASPRVMSRILDQLASGGRSSEGRTGHELLCDRELQVYVLIGEGHSTKEISEKLGMSTKTVQTHREHIKVKLGLKSSAELSYSAVLWSKKES